MNPPAYLTWPWVLFILTTNFAILFSSISRCSSQVSGLLLKEQGNNNDDMFVKFTLLAAHIDPLDNTLHSSLLQVLPNFMRKREQNPTQNL